MSKDVKVVVDATKQALKDVLPYHPFLIKPNHIELGELFDVAVHTPQEAIPYGKQLIDKGAEHVIVSMGNKGNLLFKNDHVYYANIPEGKLKNSVGAGDSVVAGFIASYVQQGESVEAFRYGATGVKHRLTEDDIAQATVIIVAADKQVDMARFNGKPVIQVPVAQGI